MLKKPKYAARHNLGPIPRYEVEETFRLTIETAGKEISDDALLEAVKAIDSFSFMLQLAGYRSWNAAGAAKSIDINTIERGVRLAQEELEDCVFDATIVELSKGDRAFMQATTPDEGLTYRSDLTQRLGKSSGYISTYQKRLLEAGVIEEPESDVFRFVLPDFRDYLLRIIDMCKTILNPWHHS